MGESDYYLDMHLTSLVLVEKEWQEANQEVFFVLTTSHIRWHMWKKLFCQIRPKSQPA